ncbi:hypothetical protein [Emticicia sp. BO119]|uniref:hypothetical protein n=1 Tax=Emticicia sp. BO119 TaxID=2757768 RepID=UPI0015F115A8|nr:hypothetical protein [Emticicia sp. BO119]MBA4849008.1 hypothetical protein [Emticicia sp. BO119]
MAQGNLNKTFLIVAEVSPEGRIAKVIEKEETTIQELVNYHQRKEYLEKQVLEVTRNYHLLMARYENISQKNEAALAALTGLLTAYGVYDPQKHTLNLEPIVKPYVLKTLQDIQNQEARLGYLAGKWEDFKLKHKLKLSNLLLSAAQWFGGFFKKKDKS